MTERAQFIDLEIDGAIATIVLNRPEKLNAWSWESARQICARADEIRFDSEVRVVLVRAEGRAFCAGVDLGMPEDRITGRSPAEKARNYYEKFRWVHERFHVLSNLPQPVIMAIQGYCLGAGLEVAMMGDIPFHSVVIHASVLDESGRKMQKSLGNGIDPIEMIDLYGADAVRGRVFLRRGKP